MGAAARRAGRSIDEITLVAVSKTHPAELVLDAIDAGQADFGENRVEEAWAKFVDPDLPGTVHNITSAYRLGGRPEARLHLIGPIQSRKAELAVACQPVLVHAVDRLKIAERLDRFAGAAGARLDILLEVNVSGEASKFGFTPAGLWQEIEAILALPALRVCGLMTLPPIVDDPEDTRDIFADLRRLRDRLAARWPQADWHHLSMGMSHDFEVAIEEGATLVRVGTAIFGTRST
jgi:hypothetical protein